MSTAALASAPSLAEFPAYKRLPLDVAGAQGCEIILRDGQRLLDLYGGHCVNTLGAGDPQLGTVIARQWERLSFATNLLDHEPRRQFLAAFEKNLPAGSWQVFCSNSGAEANENALKLALKATGRKRVVAFRGAFHGRTAGAGAVTDGKQWCDPPFEVARAAWGSVAEVDARTAAVILEPIQSLAGVVDPPAGFLAALRAACDAHGALLIYDEVQTGSGRLGAPWAAQHYGVTPDLFTTAKGAGGGLPIGITVALAQAVSQVPGNALGSTFGGGPLVLAAAAHVAQRIHAPGFLENVRASAAVLARSAGTGPVQRVRGAGLLLGLELQAGVSAASVRDALLTRGILAGTCDDPQVLRLCPPLILTPQQAQRLPELLADRTLLP
jgi:acetylornithine/succinyldiaminopimelate/putrescine aminotransferase